MWRVFDLEDVNVRIGVVLSIIITTVSITWWASSKFAWIQSSIELLVNNMLIMTDKMQKQEEKNEKLSEKFGIVQWDVKVLLYKVESIVWKK